MPALTVPLDGRLTSQNVLAGPLTGGELMYIVSPGTAKDGNSYQISTKTLANFFSSFFVINPTIITSGASYNSVATDTRILVNKTVGSATAILLLGAASYVMPVLIKDLKGDADVNPITVTFTGTEKMDGLSTVVINNPFGYFWFNPLTTGGWYDAGY